MKKCFVLFLTLICLCLLSSCDGFEVILNRGGALQTTESTTAAVTTAPVGGEVCQHSFGEWTTIKKATCNEEGEKSRTCGKCFETETCITGKSNTHSCVPIGGIIPTCKDNGLTDGLWCDICGLIFEEQAIIPATNDHSYVHTVIPPTQTEQGYVLHRCSVCGDNYKDGFSEYEPTEILYSSNGDGTCLVSGLSNANDTAIVIPETSPNGETVVGIKARAFYNKPIVSVSAPTTLKEIGERAFGECKKLKTVYLPGVIAIGDYAFFGCDVLASVVYSDSMDTVGREAFRGCKALKECRAISSAKNLDTVINFGYHAFAFSGIENPVFSADLTPISLANSPFFECSLGRVDLSAATLTAVGSAFSGTGFTEFLFPKGITTINAHAFASCYFESLTIPDSVTEIEYAAFYDAYFTEVTLGKQVRAIGDSAFEGTWGEVNLAAATALENVGYRAFAGSDATSIILPGSVQRIGIEAFADCSNLQILGIPFISISTEPSIYSTNCFGAIFKNGAENSTQKNYIPASLKTVIITADSVDIEYGDFTFVKLNALILPESFTVAYRSLDFSLSAIYYCGDSESFPNVSEAIDKYSPPKIYYYSESAPQTAGNYWHYLQGIPTPW